MRALALCALTVGVNRDLADADACTAGQSLGALISVYVGPRVHGYWMLFGNVPARSGVVRCTVKARRMLCTSCLYAPGISVGLRRRSDSPPRTAFITEFPISASPARERAQ